MAKKKLTISDLPIDGQKFQGWEAQSFVPDGTKKPMTLELALKFKTGNLHVYSGGVNHIITEYKPHAATPRRKKARY